MKVKYTETHTTRRFYEHNFFFPKHKRTPHSPSHKSLFQTQRHTRTQGRQTAGESEAVLGGAKGRGGAHGNKKKQKKQSFLFLLNYPPAQKWLLIYYCDEVLLKYDY